MTDQELSDDTFSPGEAAFFSSGGQDVSGLEGGQQASQEAAQEADKQADAGQQQEGQAQQQAEDKGGQPRHVPLAVLHEERTRRQAMEAENAKLRENNARFEGRLTALNELLAPEEAKQQQKQAEWIDPEKDIFGAFNQLKERYADLSNQQKTGQQQLQQRDADAQRREAYQRDAGAFMQKTPDFGDAYKHLMEVRAQELMALGMTDEKQIMATLANEEAQIVNQAFETNKSPSELIYNLAKYRGFSPKQQQAQNQQTQAQQQLENIQKGKEASLSLGGAGGSSSEGLTASALADMSDEEFSEVMSKLSEAQKKKLMGG